MGLLFFLQFIVGVLLIVVILLHSPKEQGMGAINGQARIFRAESELEKGLDQTTTILSVIFISLSLLINIIN